jgi:hypothetical protein
MGVSSDSFEKECKIADFELGVSSDSFERKKKMKNCRFWSMLCDFYFFQKGSSFFRKK